MKINKNNFSKYKKSNFLITGATGSFGQKFIEILQKIVQPKKIVIFSRDELKQFDMQKKFNSENIRYFLGDIRDEKRLEIALNNIDIVIHAAALKQVPAAEYNPTEVIKTNITGAENLIRASIKNKVKKVIALSTDKAASPINLYGATKLVSDKLFSSANMLTGGKGPIFSIVRYGNVLNSRGSVVPFFLEKIENKEKFIPITHPDMTRFFLTLEEGVHFVLKSLKRMQGGEIFIPKCPSFKITDLAKSLKENIIFKNIGLRPGEKLHEILCPKDSYGDTIEFSDFYLIKPTINFGENQNYTKLPTKEVGKYVKENFEYDSYNNKNKLNASQIKNFFKTNKVF
ncbi:UDP-N-acetylglucosamine 4,6-dehydratase (inverting) [Candidatus Pelagibacter sp.]|nr:UDP-N-acetylglucosamine 4,6-dehydratase (inverting) [Candidatus Pelagibacter sp.]|tara:strand:- start:375 stop:1403 length:1029 start_codon:yes stop_codon:yes gene_type:complete